LKLNSKVENREYETKKIKIKENKKVRRLDLGLVPQPSSSNHVAQLQGLNDDSLDPPGDHPPLAFTDWAAVLWDPFTSLLLRARASTRRPLPRGSNVLARLTATVDLPSQQLGAEGIGTTGDAMIQLHASPN
jgi:hypothetical protein